MSVPIELLCRDERGTIERIAPEADVIRILSKAGSRRANHYHKQHGHWCVVMTGEVTYLERPVGAGYKPSRRVYYKGDMFWTGPMVEHLMLFEDPTDDTVFYCFSVGKRDQGSYEADTVRLPYRLDEV